MGCDIHIYVEHKRRDSDLWRSFGGRINPGRIYGMFAKLANVRNDYGIVPIDEPRGLPDDMSYESFSDYTLFIVEKEDHESGYVTRERAERWVNNGSSKYYMDKAFISGPDWHSESWCTSSELETAINEIWSKGYNGSEIEWIALLDIMKSFERQGHDSRLLFWFDN